MKKLSSVVLSNVLVTDVPITKIKSFEHAANVLKAYGTVFRNFDKTPCNVVQWPKVKGGYREVEDGLSGGDNVTEGEFILKWTNYGDHIAINSGVKDGHYCFAWNSKQGAVVSSTSTLLNYSTSDLNVRHAYCYEEINYHSCGSQLFQCLDYPVSLLLAKVEGRHVDDIQPSDFRVFILPSGVGVNIDPLVWHSPPIAVPNHPKVNMKTKQAKVHSKIYYDPLQEHNTLLRIDFTKVK